LPTDQINRRSDARAVNYETVSGLVESIGAVGLINPIRVRQSGEGWEVIAGVHRLEACKALGLAEVTCDVVTDDDLHAELAMIDENLCRAELSPSDRARQTARRKAIYEELNPSTIHGANLEGGGVAKSATPETPRFTAATAAVTGQSERAVQLNAERGQKILPDVLDMIKGTKLDTGTYMDKLKSMPGSDQFKAAQRDLLHIRNIERQQQARASLPPAVKNSHQQRQAASIAKVEAATVESLLAEVAELREANEALERENARLKASLSELDGMRVQYEQGGFSKILADKDEEIRVVESQRDLESRDKVSWKRSADFWKEQANRLGYNDDVVIDMETGAVVNA
ncbi:hypothetical protein EON82_22500, partial [bacterium]